VADPNLKQLSTLKGRGSKEWGNNLMFPEKNGSRKIKKKNDNYEGKLNQKVRKELSRKRMAALRSNTNYIWQHTVMTKNMDLNIKKTWI